MTTNLQLAKSLADFADALADYNHLPPLTIASLGVDEAVTVRVSAIGDMHNVHTIATWAAAFRATVKVDLSNGGRDYGSMTVDVQIGSRPVQITTLVGLDAIQTIATTAALGAVTSVPAVDLLAALDSKAVA